MGRSLTIIDADYKNWVKELSQRRSSSQGRTTQASPTMVHACSQLLSPDGQRPTRSRTSTTALRRMPSRATIR